MSPNYKHAAVYLRNSDKQTFKSFGIQMIGFQHLFFLYNYIVDWWPHSFGTDQFSYDGAYFMWNRICDYCVYNTTIGDIVHYGEDLGV
jgi:hypothetical protein